MTFGTDNSNMNRKIADLFRVLWKTAFFLLCGAVLGTVLLAVVFCIPVDRIFSNYQTIGMESINRRDGWHKYLVDYDASTLDNNTEWLMLKVSATPPPDTGENILQKALRCYTLNNEWNHGLTFQEYEWKGQTYSCDSYERYWHGYAVLLKPLLCVFTYTDLVFINFAAQVFVMFFILRMLGKRNMARLQIPFLFFWIVSMQIIVALCLDYSVCFYIYAFAVLLLLCRPDIRLHYPYFFLVIGMVTSYMDLLTWPLVTLAVPLMVFLQMEEKERGNIRKTAVSTLFWGVGYIGQWASKWVIASVFLDDNIIMDAVRQFLLRSSIMTGDTGENFSWFDTIRKNMSVFHKGGFMLLFLVIAIWLIYTIVKRSGELQWKKGIPYLVVFLLPFLWYLFTRNHAYIHYWMTWRILATSVFALCCAVVSVAGKREGSGNFSWETR